jgi:hypothetical protein
MVSIELPGALGTSIFTARLGKSCARLCNETEAQASAHAAEKKYLSISFSSKSRRADAPLV